MLLKGIAARTPDLSKLDFSVDRGVNAKQAEGKAYLHEGHGFSRGVRGLQLTEAAEVRFSGRVVLHQASREAR